MKSRCEIELRFRVSATARQRLRYDVTIPRPGSFWHIEPHLAKMVWANDVYHPGDPIHLHYRVAV